MGSGTYAMLSAASGAELKRYLQEYREALSEQRTASYTSAVGEAERFGGFAAYYELMTQRGKSAAAVAALNAQTSLLTQGKGYSVAQQNTISEALGLLSNAELADLLDDNAASLATFADILDIFSDTNEEIMSKGTFSEQLEMYRALKNEYGENSTALELLTKKYPILINLDEDLGASMAELMDKYQMSATTLNNLANETKEFNKKAGTNIK